MNPNTTVLVSTNIISSRYINWGKCLLLLLLYLAHQHKATGMKIISLLLYYTLI